MRRLCQNMVLQSLLLRNIETVIRHQTDSFLRSDSTSLLLSFEISIATCRISFPPVPNASLNDSAGTMMTLPFSSRMSTVFGLPSFFLIFAGITTCPFEETRASFCIRGEKVKRLINVIRSTGSRSSCYQQAWCLIDDEWRTRFTSKRRGARTCNAP